MPARIIGMLDKSIGADFVLAWPTARVTIVGAETAASVIFAREIRDSRTPEETKAQRIKEYSDLYENAYVAADRRLRGRNHHAARYPQDD